MSDPITIEVPLKITISLGDESVNIPVPKPIPIEEPIEEPIPPKPTIGFDHTFLSHTVFMPSLSEEMIEDSVEYDGGVLINYTHFSVNQCKSRKLPRYVCWNVDGGDLKSISRKGIKFKLDNRIPEEYQAGNDVYKNNPYDRGHIARRADLTWGPINEAKQANLDSFYFTNIAPQHEAFNQSGRQGLWGQLEDAIREYVIIKDLRMSVMAGPIFKNNDPRYRNIQVPRDFWKVIAFHDESDDAFKVAAYILTQQELVSATLDSFSVYQVTLSHLTAETGLGFEKLMQYEERMGGIVARHITKRDEVWV